MKSIEVYQDKLTAQGEGVALTCHKSKQAKEPVPRTNASSKDAKHAKRQNDDTENGTGSTRPAY